MKSLIIVMILLAVSGCTQEQVRNFGQAFSQASREADERRYKEAEYRYHTRPYKFLGGVYVPSRRP